VSEISELRDFMRKSGAEYKVCKNTLFWLALKEAPFKEQIKDSLKGSTGVVFGFDDPVIAVKKAFDFSEKNEKLKIKLGVVEGKAYSLKELKEVSSLPSKNVLLSMLASGMSSPLTKMACALQAINQKLLYALEQLKNKKAQ
jgi:large subunit ribosomal protein L10